MAALAATGLAACSGWHVPPPLTEYTANSGGPVPPEYQAQELLRADLDIRVEPSERRIDATASLVLRAKAPLNAVFLDLDREFEIGAVLLDGQIVDPAAWANPGGQLRVDLPQALPAGSETVVTVRYGGRPHEARRAPWDGGFVWSQAPGGEPWVATAVQGEGCDLFWPCIDHPTAEPAQVDLHIRVPSPLVAASNGVLLAMQELDGWRHYHWRTRHPNTYAIALNIGPYERLEADYRSRYGNTVPLRFWYLGVHGEQARALFDEFPRMLDFFEQYIGPYPFADEKMGVVETPHLGMEHQTINAYGNGYRKDAYGYDWLLQHEFAHEWFGNQLTNVDWDDMWLHEGFASYMQPLYAQYLNGDMAYHAALFKQRAGIQNRVPLVSGQPRYEESVYDETLGPGGDLYAKGSLLLHSLRQLIGDEAFFEATRRLVYGRPDPRPGDFAPRYACSQDFIDAVQAATGRDYGWFFDVYLREAALPALRVERTGGAMSLRWEVPGDKPFPMPVELRLGGRLVQVPMPDGQGRAPVSSDDIVIVDPQSKLLRRLESIEQFQAYEKAQESE